LLDFAKELFDVSQLVGILRLQQGTEVGLVGVLEGGEEIVEDSDECGGVCANVRNNVRNNITDVGLFVYQQTFARQGKKQAFRPSGLTQTFVYQQTFVRRA